MRASDFDRLYAEHAQGLFGFLTYRTGDRAEAEDLVAETFEAAFRAHKRFDPRRAGERTWLYAIALNRLRDHARRRGAERRALERVGVDPTGHVAEPLERVEERDLLARGMASLTDEERECVALRFGGDLTLKEIAGVLGEPMTTVEGRVYRALRKLRIELQDGG